MSRVAIAGDLISRHPGTGTRVERATSVAAFTAQLGNVGDLTQYGEAAVRSVLSVEPVTVDAALAAVTGLAEEARQVCITSTRRDPGSPDEVVSWAQVYLGPVDAKAVAGDLEESRRLIAGRVVLPHGPVDAGADAQVLRVGEGVAGDDPRAERGVAVRAARCSPARTRGRGDAPPAPG